MNLGLGLWIPPRAAASGGGSSPTLAEQYGVVSRWRLEEATGTRVDSFGSLDLTAFNGPDNFAGIESNALRLLGASTQYLEGADDAAYPGGDDDVWFTGFLKISALPVGQDYTLWSKYGAAGQRTLALQLRETTNDLFVRATADGTTHTFLAHGTALAINTWYFYMLYHDKANDLLGICVNNGAFVTGAHAGGLFDSTAPFRVGYRGDNFDPFDGLQDEINYGKNPIGGMAANITDIRDYLWTPPADPWA